MNTFRDWFWAIQATGQGPHYYFTATFAEADAERLAAHITEQALPGFGHCHFVGTLIGAPCGSGSYHGPYELFIDQSNHAALATGLASVPPRLTVAHTIWHLLGICGHELGIECSYGGFDQQLTQTETALLVQLAQDAELSMVHWQVSSGGEGYTPCFVSSGRSAAELLTYLQLAAPEKPDFTQIEQALRQVLLDPAFAGTYQIGESTQEGWQMRVVVLHTVQKSTSSGTETWDMTTHSIALDTIAHQVHEQCHVPTYLAGSAHSAHDPNQLIGSVLGFGYTHIDNDG